ncbi:hypothetical protein PRK78_006620 [Emydomyces testavorans]|uniref:Uncharacterized protein n=1 Tax=Emydomyces testavorans TaxID=2070801 RepID=A0AAF0DQJ3_9EURO|nr:hypothetical protein PRK78_006620 [Emydomyces testavorans]
MSNSQLHLQPVNHRVAQRGRPYSYLQTPAEYQAPTFPPRNCEKASDVVANPTPDRSISSRPQDPPPFSHTAPFVNNPPLQTTSHMAASVQSQMNPSPPPLSEHPAQFAPYADPPTPPDQHTQPPQFQNPPPASPGPLPRKQDHTADVRQPTPKKYTVAPDSNPLAPPDPVSTPKPSSLSGNRSQLGTRITPHELHHVPGQVLHPRQEVRGGTWSHALCDCRDPGVCCLGLWCPCILYGRTQYRLSRKSEKKDPTNLLGYEACNASCTAIALLCGCHCMFSGHFGQSRFFKMIASSAC